VSDLVDKARRMIELLDASDAAGALAMCSDQIQGYVARGWSMEEHVRKHWHGALDDLAGAPRTIVDVQQVTPARVRFTFEGPRGRGFAAVWFEADGSVGGFPVHKEFFDGISNVVITCPDERVQEIKDFYGSLLVFDYWDEPQLVFDEGFDYHPPAWGDPDRPQQMHVDIRVGDVAAADEIVLAKGADLLRDAGTHRIYADPIGHPFCLYPSSGEHEVGELWRVVIDCPDPRELASFYEGLLGMVRLADTPDFVVAQQEARMPMLGFQRVTPYVAPRWPDPAHGAQMHLDIKFDDAHAAIVVAERLGATRLPPGGSCPVYADPAGHPFCLCMHGQ
jgi:catechol 2,3-dioxygenase-like lactoylglutathione lyase family enzyme